MKRIILNLLLVEVLLIGVSGCGSNLSYKKETNDNVVTNDDTNNTSDDNSSNIEKIELKDYTITYGTYKGTATSGGYTLTETVIISKNKMQIDDWETCEYEVKDNIIYCKQADAIQLKVIGNNMFTDASGAFIFELED